MPRTARASVGGICYHVMNRGNGGLPVFHTDGDYETFLLAMEHACAAVPMRVLSYCLMPNHYHLVVWPRNDGDLSRWMHWLQNAHVRRYHQHYQSSGHLWQGRFKAFPIQKNEYLLAVLRYAERNPVRAKLVKRAEKWPWSSAALWQNDERPVYLAAGPVRRPAEWPKWVNQAIMPGELEALRRSVNRGTPFGSPIWVAKTAEQLDLQSTIRPRGRPRKDAKDGAK